MEIKNSGNIDGFLTIRNRLVARLRRRVQNGEITERQLARASGISQPHIHNALKGLKTLSDELADVLMTYFQMSILDLFDREELLAYLARTHPAREQRLHPVPMLDGLLGRGLPLPRKGLNPEVHSVPYSQIAAATDPLVVSLAGDPQMEPLFADRDLVLLDQSEAGRRFFQPESYYVVRTESGMCVRSLRSEDSELLLVTERTKHSPASWERIDLTQHAILDVVLARVIWLHRRRRWEDVVA